MISSYPSVQPGRSVLVPGQRAPRKSPAPATEGILTGNLIRVAKGQTLYVEGDDPTTPYLVISGVLRNCSIEAGRPCCSAKLRDAQAR